MLLAEFYPPQNIVQAYDMSTGVFACRFWHLGQWRIVVVDDSVPCRKSRKQPGMVYAIGAECRDGKSVFLPIVEKAYGKLMGYSYRCLCPHSLDFSCIDSFAGAELGAAWRDMPLQTFWVVRALQ